MQRTLVLAAASVAISNNMCVAAPTLTVLGTMSRAGGVSANGHVIAGGASSGNQSSMHVGRWTTTTGFQDLGMPADCDPWYTTTPQPTAVSPEGAVIAWSINYTCMRNFRWSESAGFQELPTPPEAVGQVVVPVAISGYGGLVIGSARSPLPPYGDNYAIVLWPLTGNPVYIAPPADCISSGPKAVTPDGNVIVGTCAPILSGVSHPFRWTHAAGYEQFSVPSPYYMGNALSVSPDGSIVYGWCLGGDSSNAFYLCKWVNGIFEIMHGIENGPIWTEKPIDMSWDGKVMVTQSFMWVEGQPAPERATDFILRTTGIYPPGGTRITELSLDGSTLILDPGWPTGSYVLRGLIGSACAADFNNDGVVDFFDYLDFVDAFSIGCGN